MDPTARKTLLNTARRLVADGKPSRACRLVERQSAANPDDEALRWWLAVFVAETGDYTRAVPVLQEAIARKPRFLPAAHALMRIPLRRGEPDEARRVYGDLAARVPRFASTLRATCQTDPVGQEFRRVVEHHAAPDHDCVVFYHLPFTGGTSWQRALTYPFDHRQRFNIRRKSGLRHLARYSRLSPDEWQRIRYVHLHHPYPLDPRGRRLLYFTVLREPTAWFLSSYHKRLGDPRILGTGDWRHGTPDLAANVAHAAAVGLTNSQARHLAVLHPEVEATTFGPTPRRVSGRITAEEDLLHVRATARLPDDELLSIAIEVLDTMFLTPVVLEHMEAGHLSVFAQLGIPVIPKLQHIGASSRKHDVIDDSVRTRIADLHPVDTQLYTHARERFEARFGDLITAVDKERAGKSQ